MELKFFRVPVFDSTPAEAEVNRFLQQHRILSMESQLIADGLNSAWTLCVQYEARRQSHQNYQSTGSTSYNFGSSPGSKVDFKAIMSPPQFACYSRLRELRKRLAERDGIRPYNVFTNNQLSAMVFERTSTRAAVAKIEGVGGIRMQKYADAFIDVVARWASEQPVEERASSEKATSETERTTKQTKHVGS